MSNSIRFFLAAWVLVLGACTKSDKMTPIRALRRSGRIYVFQREHTTIVRLLSDGKTTPTPFWTTRTMKTAIRISVLIGLIFAVIFVAVWRFYPDMPVDLAMQIENVQLILWPASIFLMAAAPIRA